MARLLDGATRVRRITVADRPDLYLFEVERNHGTPALVVWERRGIADQDDSPNEFVCDWSFLRAHVVDAHGARVPVDIAGGVLRVQVSSTPLFIDGAVEGQR